MYRSENLDTRDLQDRIDELELSTANIDTRLYDEEMVIDERSAEEKEEEEFELRELEVLNKLKDEVGSEWNYGVTLIHEDNFTDHVRDLCEDCGYISRDFPWWIEIDWERTADHVRSNYSKTEFGGETYYYQV